MSSNNPRLKVAEFAPSIFAGDNYFAFDPISGANERHKTSSGKDRMDYCSGWGSVVAVSRAKPIFVAIYIHENAVNLWAADLKILLTDDLRATVEKSWPVRKIFRVKKDEKVLLSVPYVHSVDEDDDDLFEHIAKTLNDINGLKGFAYLWSATLLGRHRKLPKFGLTSEMLDRIQNPYDGEHDVES